MIEKLLAIVSAVFLSLYGMVIGESEPATKSDPVADKQSLAVVLASIDGAHLLSSHVVTRNMGGETVSHVCGEFTRHERLWRKNASQAVHGHARWVHAGSGQSGLRG